MTAVANIVLPDALATPVNHTFIPLGPDKQGTWWYEDTSAVNSIGTNKISLSISRPVPAAAGQSSQGRVSRVKIGIHTPVMETLSSSTISGIPAAPTLAYVNRANLEYIIPERADMQNRKDLLKYSVGLLGNVQVVAMIHDLQNVF